MSKKIYVCSECRHEFPNELSELIDKKVQVYCEACGSPFSLEGIQFKAKPFEYRRGPRQRPQIFEKSKEEFNKWIQFLNKISYIPILVISIVALALISEIAIHPERAQLIFFRQLFFGISGILIVLYDIFYISPRVKEERYNEIMIDSFCWGILGCIFFGTGVIILIKGIIIFFYVIANSDNRDLKPYDFGLLLKNSLNNFSAKAGVVIIIIVLYFIAIRSIIIAPIPEGSDFIIDSVFFTVIISIAGVALLIDFILKNNLEKQQKFFFIDFVRVLAIGIMSTIFFSVGIFILLKGVLIFFLMFGSPSPAAVSKEKIPVETRKETVIQPPIQQSPPSKTPPVKPIEPRLEKEEIKSPKQLRKEIKIKIHESLLPIKDEKDKEIVTEYFTRIFAVLSKDMRNQIMDLKISKEEKKGLLKELAFLSAEEQIKYVEALVNLYQEIPKKLINKIKKLPNVKPEYYGKIVKQLKYMDFKEQVRFIEFLEQNA